MNEGWPKPCSPPQPDDVVQVLMTEEMARRFEARVLGKGNTVGHTYLSPPLKFAADDLPTYIMGTDAAEVAAHREP